MNLSKAQNVCMEIEAQYRIGKYVVNGVKWNEVYENEDDLVNAIREIAIPTNRVAPIYTFKGYEYIFSFAQRLQDGKELTEAQLRQAKRLAVEIKKANAISEYMKGV